MAKKLGKLAARYGKAFLNAVQVEVTNKGATFDEVANGFFSFVALWEQEREISAFLLNPMFERDARKKVLRELSAKLGLADITQKFLLVLLERDRIIALPEIARAFHVLLDEQRGIIQVEITTARALNPDEARDTEREIRAYMKGDPRFHWNVDEKLLGGMIVRCGGKVIDGSLLGKLERAQRSLMA